jgi:hypothetical protein
MLRRKIAHKGFVKHVPTDQFAHVERDRPIAADDPVHDVVERLLHVSGQWVVAAAVDRDETKRRMLEIVECVIGLFTS